MDRVLKPIRLEVEPDSATAADDFKHWRKTFEGYLEALTAAELQPDNLKVLTNLVSPQVYRHIIDVDTYEAAISMLTDLYVKQRNTVAARHQLLTCKQQIGESIDNFVVRLKRLSKECDCKAVSAEQYRLELVRDALITGIQSQTIRQRLLEESSLTFEDAFKKARAMELASTNSEAYRSGTACSTRFTDATDNAPEDDSQNYLRATTSQRFCFFCGDDRHPRKDCPAIDAVCGYCQKLGHYSKVCQKRLRSRNAASNSKFKSAAIQQNSSTLFASQTDMHTKVLRNVKINGILATSLMDTGSSDCFIDRRFVDKHSLPIRRSSGVVTLAETSVRLPIEGHCVTNLSVQDNEYDHVTFNVLENLSTDVIIGEKIFKQHRAVTFTFEGQRPPLTLKALPQMSVPYPKPFSHLNKDCCPQADKPRKYSKSDQEFIRNETQRLLSEELIEPSRPGPIYVKRHVRNKDEALVDEAELLEVNPNYAHVRLGDGRETTISLRDISPRNNGEVVLPNSPSPDCPLTQTPTDVNSENTVNEEPLDEPPENNAGKDDAPLRRSTRFRKPVEKYGGVPYV